MSQEELRYPVSGIAPYKPNYKLRNAYRNEEGHKYLSPFGHPYNMIFDQENQTRVSYPTLKDKQILALSYAIRQKPEWWIKYKNPEIVAKWQKETVASKEERDEFIQQNGMKAVAESPKVLQPLFDFVIAELAWYEKLKDSTDGQFQLAYSDYVFFGDKVIPSDLKTTFIKAAKKLEDIPDDLRDWHPGSNQQVWDLIHPSLYPLQYGITPVVKDLKNDHVGFEINYKGGCVPMPEYNFWRDSIKSDVSTFGISKRFQWLPSIFNVAKDGKVTIESYINNLHPVHYKDLYRPIADIFARFIPGINAALSQYASKEHIRDNPFTHEEGLYGPEPEFDENDPNYDEKYDEYIENRVPIVNDPVFEMPSGERVSQIDVHGTKLKVIVKMANIQLTPENPEYAGGTWHVEGTINEDIVCSCLYYYDVENITDDSELEFRAATDAPIYEQYDSDGVLAVYGLENGDLNTFYVGGVKTIEDRLIVFPNMLQHHVKPFKLQDKTKPGHRKILCFFVCDPYNDNVISTDQVPPQQSNWWSEQVLSNEEELKNNHYTIFDQLPTEVLEAIFDEVEWPMSLKRAKEVREELMEERSINSKKEEESEPDRNPFYRHFSLCEH
ncbi:uncharacterized protein SAPINGB_P005153 [Magnusiomyces paraingens]|uniref:Uncharacterized protein n=1 Tax=Magnusiomyces paraingens TaxID=2606893 RepID=A0A5E8BYJ3_9ASCO|nr:uncharacterized protein SAPINGB_P005153 [Saprochaete ingens]VVT56564.1 unnamed protein product [Saprochaete ingens]